MLPGFYNPPFVRPDVSATFLGASSDTANGTSYTLPGVDFGDPVSDRIIHLVVASYKSANGVWSSITIGGVTATQLTQAASTAWVDVSHVFAAVPTGTSGSVVLTSSGSRSNVVIMPYRIVNWTALPVSAVQEEGTGTTTSIATSISRSIPGLVIGGSMAENVNDITWSGLTEDYDAATETIRASSASLVNGATGTLNVTASGSGSVNRRITLCQWN